MNLIEIHTLLAASLADGETWYDHYVIADFATKQLTISTEEYDKNPKKIAVAKLSSQDFEPYRNPETGNIDSELVETWEPELLELQGEYWGTACEEFQHFVHEDTGSTIEEALIGAFKRAIIHTPAETIRGLSVNIEYDEGYDEYNAEVLYVEDSCMAIGIGSDYAEDAVDDYHSKGAEHAAAEVMSWYEREWMKGTPEWNEIQHKLESELDEQRKFEQEVRDNPEWARENYIA